MHPVQGIRKARGPFISTQWQTGSPSFQGHQRPKSPKAPGGYAPGRQSLLNEKSMRLGLA